LLKCATSLVDKSEDDFLKYINKIFQMARQAVIVSLEPGSWTIMKQTEKKIVVALGDSITYGWPFTPEVSWVEAINGFDGWQAINAGIPGDTLMDMADRLERDVLRYKPQAVTVMGGTNDFYHGFSQSQMQDSFTNIMRFLKEEDIEPWIGLPLPVTDSTERSLQKWRQWLKDYADGESLFVVDFYQDFINEQGKIKEKLLLDGCHPSMEGYRVMSARIKAALQKKSC